MRHLMLAFLPLTLAACQQAAEESDDIAAVETEGTVAPAATPSEPASPPDPAPAPAPGAAGIPPALQGRWGMVPADCTSTRGDAKGLLTIGPETLRFYESVGTLARQTARGERMIRGQFAFTGEGMEWTRDVELSLSGDTLTRIERGGEEPGGPFTYTKCPA